MSYYNTNNETGETLKTSRKRVNIQEKEIVEVFSNNPSSKMTPFDVQDNVGHHVPITSIRRAITNLTERGVLTKSDIMKKGRYGKMNHCWELVA
jgi:predicted HTH transcriptional regulator